MKVHQVMTSLVGVIAPENSIVEAARKMKSMNVGVLPVFSKNGLVGMITDRDIVLRSSAEGHNPHIVPVESVMTLGVDYIFYDSEVEDAARIMVQKHIRRLPVMNKDKALVGIISLGDIAWRCDNRLAGETLREICTIPD
jgi:CBS domain-containing protein